jgi:hypothetical protein
MNLSNNYRNWDSGGILYMLQLHYICGFESIVESLQIPPGLRVPYHLLAEFLGKTTPLARTWYILGWLAQTYTPGIYWVG